MIILEDACDAISKGIDYSLDFVRCLGNGIQIVTINNYVLKLAIFLIFSSAYLIYRMSKKLC